jgi:hypothetical protein
MNAQPAGSITLDCVSVAPKVDTLLMRPVNRLSPAEVLGRGGDALLDTWQDLIANYFINHQTSGFVEGLNNKLKVLKRRC